MYPFFKLAAACAALLSLGGCALAKVQVDYMDPHFRRMGLSGGVISIACVERGCYKNKLPPAEERQIIADARELLLASHPYLNVLKPGVKSPAYRLEIEIISDMARNWVSRDFDTEEVATSHDDKGNVTSTTTVCEYSTDANIRRELWTLHRIIHAPTARIVWQVSGRHRKTATRSATSSSAFPPTPAFPSGPLASEILCDITKKAFKKLP